MNTNQITLFVWIYFKLKVHLQSPSVSSAGVMKESVLEWRENVQYKYNTTTIYKELLYIPVCLIV